MSDHGHREALPAQERGALERRLADIQVELEVIARERLRGTLATFPPDDGEEELEAEADAIRVRLGTSPAIGRPPRESWLGWAALVVAIAAIIVVVALLTR
ncbi:hypothetical protein ACNPM4_02800 [Microbacterium sp. AGC62]|uniref:hypothetical protein n=1 Tax=Microbacterium sp. ISL-59 TaxID=2819159 RepID=UPI001BE673B4|nr:hypothetical protein [Microbacterium sp. ISL-59]MBT2496774.1 hypothetical protein [Microbacterium sp. ISL-59]